MIIVVLFMVNIYFEAFKNQHLPLWWRWVEKPQVKSTWFVEGYQTTDRIHEKIQGNGYDYPFVIILDGHPIGFIQACDLHAYRSAHPGKQGIFSPEVHGMFGMDIFIGEEDYLDRGYGSKIVRAFANYLFENFGAQAILIDPAVSNTRAIRCYEKAGFQFLRDAFDGVTHCRILRLFA